MKIQKRSMFTGTVSEMELDVTPEQMAEFNGNQQTRRHIQHIFPNLNADEREFLLTGVTPEQWKRAFGEGE